MLSIPPEELHRRPAIRTLTVRYILSLLKYLHEGGKADLLQNGALCRALFQNLRDDPPDLVKELLSVTEQHVFKDDELQRSAKASLLVQQNLERVTAVATQSADGHAAASPAFAWLTTVCTTPSYGILRPSGWYPSGTTHLTRRRLNDDTIDLGLDSIDFYDRDDRPTIRNPILLSWLLTLHPWSNPQERELVLTAFRSAPELVAAYFAEKEKSLQLEPKLSNTWIGYASFLFEVVQLPVPERFGHGKDWAQLPPQTSVVIESLLPRPLTQKVLGRCLNQSSELITFFAVRVLVLALEKLRTVREKLEHGAQASEHALWTEASQRLLERFTDQAPLMKDVIGTFRQIPDDEEHTLQREAIARLLRLYYEVLPLQALKEQFDVSNALTAALGRTQEETERTQMTELRALELQHLLQIARRSPGMRWFGKQSGLQYSPVTTLLRLHTQEPGKKEMRELIADVLVGRQVLSGSGDLECFVASLQGDEKRDDEVMWEFLDDCLTRASRKPVKCLDDLENIYNSGDGVTPSLLFAVLLEQAPFLLQREGNERTMRMVEVLLLLVGDGDDEDGNVDVAPGIVLEKIQQLDGWADQGLSTPDGTETLARLLEEVQISLEGTQEDVSQTKDASQQDVAPAFDPLPTEPENHPELLKWAQKDLDLALEDGDVSALVLCLCSPHQDIRTQGLAQLRKLEDRLLNSNLEDKDPIYVLLGELIETYEQNYADNGQAGRLEYIAACFATAALEVQMEPTHFLYPKLNRFLNKDPEWRVTKLPTYWIQHTILSTPDSDDEEKAYWLEVKWVLDWITDGLRTPADLEVLRRAGVFERFMALYAAPGVERALREGVVGLLWRACEIVGGAEMLVKRCGALGWLDMVRPSRTGVEGKLRRRVLEMVDGGAIEGWAGVKVDEL